MALVFKDRVKETTTTTGTITVVLAGAEAGFQAFSVIGNANTTYYSIVSGDNWEVGLGTYTLSGTTLSRDTVLESSNSGSLITLAGTSDVFCTYPAEKAVTLNGTVINDADVVATANIVDDNVTTDKLANSINTEITANTAKVTNATHTGDVTGATALTIANDAVVTAKILDLNVTDGKIAGMSSSKLTGALPAIDGSALTGLAGGIEWQSAVVTATTITVVANKGYWINTTSNVCTVTLPASASVGDAIILVDYARTWQTNAVTINQNSLNYQGVTTPNPSLNTKGAAIEIVYSGATKGWIPSVENDSTYYNYSADALVIAGGAGGGTWGGSGAGGYRTSTQILSPSTLYSVVIGAGSGFNGGQGTSSQISGTSLETISSAGGAKGGHNNGAGADGGSGGGGGFNTAAGGSGNEPSVTPSQGNDGGVGGDNTLKIAGGGGGSGAVGQAGQAQIGGAGGAGTASSITGSSVTRAGGGGGSHGTGSGGNAAGGTGGGGTGGKNGVGTTSGTVNTGGGGGGNGLDASPAGGAGAGGSGVVILSVPTANYSGVTTGSPTITTTGIYTIIQFNATGTYTG